MAGEDRVYFSNTYSVPLSLATLTTDSHPPWNEPSLPKANATDTMATSQTSEVPPFGISWNGAAPSNNWEASPAPWSSEAVVADMTVLTTQSDSNGGAHFTQEDHLRPTNVRLSYCHRSRALKFITAI